MSDQNSLILLPGMGADARMYRGQELAFPQLHIPTWITPEPRESVAHYAARMVDRLPSTGACFLGGASFGGVVALEMACLLRPVACFLIGSLRGPEALPATFRQLRSVSGLTRVAPTLAWSCLSTMGFALDANSRSLLRQLAESDGRFLTWAARAVIDWTPSPGVSELRVFQIHGSRDWLLPARLTRDAAVISGAVHVLSVTHPEEVNEFLRQGMESAAAR